MGTLLHSPFGENLLTQMNLKNKPIDKMLESTGFDPRRDIDEIVLMSDGTAKESHALIVVRGHFDAVKIIALVRQTQPMASAEVYHGVTLLMPPKAVPSAAVNKAAPAAAQHKSPAGAAVQRKMALAILNPTTAVAGDAALVRQAIDHSRGAGATLAPELANRCTNGARPPCLAGERRAIEPAHAE